MKRDMDLIRQILFRIEETNYNMAFFDVEIKGFTEQEISYHTMLLGQAGYIHARNLSSSDGSCWKPITLTWQGHEFLDAARDNTRWNKAKVLIKEKGGGVVFELLKQLLLEMMKSSIGLGTASSP